ncbi:MAG: rhodanese-like domain-containing protein [Cocleimonas sp.]|nr:rhodanese-like domain-containing protein [Cocleimonas sp.]
MKFLKQFFLRLFSSFLIFLIPFSSAIAEEKTTKQIMITHGLQSVDVKHDDKTVKIMRVQDKKNEIAPFYRKTTRGTIQSMHPFKPHAVETIGEREIIDYIKKMSEGDNSIIIIDSRTPAWVKRSGMIPGAVNIPFTQFSNSESTLEIMEDEFEVIPGETFNFSNAKTLVMYCNGNWCGQSPTAIRKLLSMGYPAAKIKYFRGGMQSWAALGLTVIATSPQ